MGFPDLACIVQSMTPIDSTKKLHHEGPCYWCGTEGKLTVYGTRYGRDTYWSPGLCGKKCHDEMYDPN